jgi:solute carrier family 25 citrate transporter 1
MSSSTEHQQQQIQQQPKTNRLLPLAAGCIAGGVEATAVWPMEFIKTQLQLQKKGSNLPYNGMVSGLTYTVRTTGEWVSLIQ